MKKFQFAAGLLALGLLASCSSEEPNGGVATTNTNADGGMYISLKLAAPATRADEATALDGESTVKSVKLYMSDENGVIFTGTATTVESDLKAYFEISEATYNYLTAVTDEVTLTVVANVIPNETLATLKTATTSDETWTSGSFYMTNNETCKGTLAEAPATKPESKENAWQINDVTGSVAIVTLDRLASRFDFNAHSNATDNTYSATLDENLKITIEGVAVNTHETETYWFAQSYNGSYKTPLFGTDSSNPTYSATNYDWKAVGAHQYARPHTIGEASKATYANAAYVAVRASFANDKLQSMKDGKDVYSYNGYLFGSIEEMLNTNVEADEDGTTLKTVAEFLAGIKELNDQRTVVEQDLLDLGCKKWTATEVDGSYKYYTYYNALVKQDANAETDLLKYAVHRNTVYEVAVASFAGLGLQDGDEPQDEELNKVKTLYMDIVMTVRAWALNTANNSIEFK